MTILLVILIFASLVLFHELGHYIAARRAGIEVEEFGFGFPPRLFGKKIGRTIYSLNLLPLGGFVRLKGEDKDDSGPGTFAAASLGSKTKVLLAGVGMNLLMAYVILVALCFTGLCPMLPGQVSLGNPVPAGSPQVVVAGISAGSPAAQAGIKKGDVLLSADGQTFGNEQDVIDFSKSHAGQQVSLSVKRGANVNEVDVRLRGADSKEGYLGIAPFLLTKLRYGWWSPLQAAALVAQLSWGTLAAFGGLIAGLVSKAQVSAQVAGPVGIVQLLGLLLPLGISYAGVFVASISISLAVINALPLPALDGGRLAVIWGQKITGRKMSPKLEAMIHTVGFVALITLMAVVTYFDVKRLGQ